MGRKRGKLIMSDLTNQKLRLLSLMKQLLEQTDEEHRLTAQELAQQLSQRQAAAVQPRSVEKDLELLGIWGFPVEQEGSNPTSYWVAQRTFELAELKLLVDAVQSSKFITRKKSDELIHKLESLASVHQGRQLQRQVYVANRIKTMNESIYSNIDRVYSGIAQNRQISFLYFEYTITKERRYRHDGRRYLVSPYALAWEDENYYLIAYDATGDIIKHYRVDKMVDIQVEEALRVGQDVFESFDMALYTKKMFGMYGGREQMVKLRLANRLIGVVIDRFGKDLSLGSAGEGFFTVTLPVAVSPQFLGWVFGLGPDAEILSPQGVVEEMRDYLQPVLARYPAKTKE